MTRAVKRNADKRAAETMSDAEARIKEDFASRAAQLRENLAELDDALETMPGIIRKVECLQGVSTLFDKTAHYSDELSNEVWRQFRDAIEGLYGAVEAMQELKERETRNAEMFSKAAE